MKVTSPQLADLLSRQSGVVARRQLVDAGAAPHDVERLVRRRELVVVHRGVYVDHTGPLSREQREWAAVLAHWPAALAGVSALPGGASGPVHVAIDHRRTVRHLDGVRTHRTAGLHERTLWNRSPPRLAPEHAAIDVASDHLVTSRPDRAFSVLAEACGSRRTTPGRILATLAGRPRMPDRRLLEALLHDLAEGSCSVLEQGYVHRVERPHGLPVGRRQVLVRSDGRSRFHDVELEQGLVIELDGRAHHDGVRARDRDARPDLDNLLVGRSTVRLTWGLVFVRGCETAWSLGALLNQRGWPGSVTPCASCSPRAAVEAQPLGGLQTTVSEGM